MDEHYLLQLGISALCFFVAICIYGEMILEVALYQALIEKARSIFFLM